MDAIASYIDHMFRSLSQTEEVRRAKRDLLQMSEDRYRELIAGGASENEAVGRVIAQFGTLDELADELGIRAEVDGAAADDSVEMSDDDAERYLRLHRRASAFIAAGVLVILCGLAALILIVGPGSGDDRRDAIGMIPLFGGIAIAIPLFLLGSLPLGRFRRYEDRSVALSPEASDHYKRQRESETTSFILLLSAGIAIVLASVGAMLYLQAVDPVASEGGESVAGLPLMMVGVGLGAGCLIMAGMRRSALDKLASEGDYDPATRNEPAERFIGLIAGPYWLLATGAYLGWSFIGEAWDRSWIIWPLAGVLFGLIAATVPIFAGPGRRDRLAGQDGPPAAARELRRTSGR